MGISGVNFAVAETGTIAIVENEGNARLATTYPGHTCGYHGNREDRPQVRAAFHFSQPAGKKRYGSEILYLCFSHNGPQRGKGRVTAPGSFTWFLLITEGATSRNQEETRESLYCIRCGACINICPVYRQVGGHSYGWVYSGPIGAIITPQLNDPQKTADLPFASSLCGACRDVCPVKIDFPHVLLSLRQKVVEETKGRANSAKIYGENCLSGLEFRLQQAILLQSYREE